MRPTFGQLLEGPRDACDRAEHDLDHGTRPLRHTHPELYRHASAVLRDARRRRNEAEVLAASTGLRVDHERAAADYRAIAAELEAEVATLARVSGGGSGALS